MFSENARASLTAQLPGNSVNGRSFSRIINLKPRDYDLERRFLTLNSTLMLQRAAMLKT